MGFIIIIILVIVVIIIGIIVVIIINVVVVVIVIVIVIATQRRSTVGFLWAARRRPQTAPNSIVRTVQYSTVRSQAFRELKMQEENRGDFLSSTAQLASGYTTLLS